MTGAVVTVDCCLRRTLLKGRFETTYVSPSQVVIRDIESERSCGIRSLKGMSINDIRIMGRTNRYVVAYTPHTLILADMEVDKVIFNL
jgi:intraflagellar transport protein 172